MAFLDVLRLLKVLPNLVKIGCGIDRLGSELEDIAAEDLPDHVVSTYGNTGKNLQVITEVWIQEMTHPVAPEYAMLMALACPKLRRIEMALKNISDFQTKVVETLGKEPYSKYASELNRLHAAH
ncbi:hypothetical protein GGI13_005030 [Coemansia sp. RSA 455]|nr:hypothetical protein GGI13_005030 [Coemansia sp. RSA 455]